jgi:hypothetical protein
LIYSAITGGKNMRKPHEGRGGRGGKEFEVEKKNEGKEK